MRIVSKHTRPVTVLLNTGRNALLMPYTDAAIEAEEARSPHLLQLIEDGRVSLNTEFVIERPVDDFDIRDTEPPPAPTPKNKRKGGKLDGHSSVCHRPREAEWNPVDSGSLH